VNHAIKPLGIWTNNQIWHLQVSLGFRSISSFYWNSQSPPVDIDCIRLDSQHLFVLASGMLGIEVWENGDCLPEAIKNEYVFDLITK
jgi:hypothetical protein